MAKPMPTSTPCTSAVITEPSTTARVTSPRYFSACARRAGSTGMSSIACLLSVRPSRRKKKRMNSIMKKLISVPKIPSATLPLSAAAP